MWGFSLLDWIQRNFPGRVTEHLDRLSINHFDGSCSDIWRRTSATPPPPLFHALGDAYWKYDGMDLFSSAFKLASLTEPRYLSGSWIVPTLDQLAAQAAGDRVAVPNGGVVFMTQAGIGYYFVTGEGRILEWDTASRSIAETFTALDEILNQWRDAIG